MYHKSCFVYLCYDFPIIGILSMTSVVLYIFVMISLLLVFYVWQVLFCISLLWFPYYWYFKYDNFCFVYLCYDFPIIGILCFTRVVLYICVLLSLLLVFYVWQVLFVYLCYDFPIIGILCFTSVVLYICVLLPYYWYFMSHKCCFVHLLYDFPKIGILCLTRVVLYICVLLSLLLVFYVSQGLFCISLLWFPYYWYFMFYKHSFCISVFCFPYYWYFMYDKCCFVYLCYDFPIIDILCFTRVVLYICFLLSLLLVFYVSQALFCISELWIPYN